MTTNSYLGSKEKVWYLQTEGAEFGPFNFVEMGHIFDSKKIKGKIFVWKKGLANWLEATSTEHIISMMPDAEKEPEFVIERGSNRRVHVRLSIIATVSVTVGGKTSTGVCLDISEGGLQVGSWDAQINKGETYSVLITPLGLTGVKPLKAEVEATWFDSESGRTGFKVAEFKSAKEERLLKEYLVKSQKSYR